MRLFYCILFSLVFGNILFAQIPDSVKQIQRRAAPPPYEVLATDSLSKAEVDKAVEILQDLEIPDTAGAKQGFISRFIKADYPNPKKAFLFSVIPGGGQIYNKRFWKLPFVYAAYGGIGYLLINNLNLRKSFNEAYAIKLELTDAPECSTTICQQIVASNLSTESIKARRQSQLKSLQLTYIGVVAVVALTGAEAFVDAHLRSFDVNDDLSFKLKPKFDFNPQTFGSSLGIGLVMNF